MAPIDGGAAVGEVGGSCVLRSSFMRVTSRRAMGSEEEEEEEMVAVGGTVRGVAAPSRKLPFSRSPSRLSMFISRRELTSCRIAAFCSRI